MDQAAVSDRCAQALQKSADVAKQIMDEKLSAEEGAHLIASNLGDCYEYLNSDIAAVDLLGAISAYSDFYQEYRLDAAALTEIDQDVVKAAAELLRLMTD